MMPRVRRLLWGVAGPWLGERPLPIGRNARDRRLLRRALDSSPVGRVLVVGSGLAVRQALSAAPIDVAGTNPHAPEVTVCSSVRTVNSLPRERWDTIVITDPTGELPDRLRAVQPACRRGGCLIVVDRGESSDPADRILAIAQVACLEKMVAGRHHRLWLARMR